MDFARTDCSDPTVFETLRICTLDSGETHYSEWLESDTRFVVQVTTGPDVGDDFVGLYDLDGEEIRVANASWTVAPAAEIPAAVIEAVEEGWASGSYVVTRAD